MPIMLNRISDHSLIRRIQGSPLDKSNAIKEFSAANIGLINKVCQSLGIAEEDAMDRFTDSLIAFTHQVELHQFKGKSKASTYFYRILYNKCVDFLRKSSTNKIDCMESPPEYIDSRSFSVEYENKEETRQILDVLHKMGEPCKTILFEWAYWGYKISEIAQRNNFGNAEQLKRKKYTCLEKLRAVIKKQK